MIARYYCNNASGVSQTYYQTQSMVRTLRGVVEPRGCAGAPGARGCAGAGARGCAYKAAPELAPEAAPWSWRPRLLRGCAGAVAPAAAPAPADKEAKAVSTHGLRG